MWGEREDSGKSLAEDENEGEKGKEEERTSPFTQL